MQRKPHTKQERLDMLIMQFLANGQQEDEFRVFDLIAEETEEHRRRLLFGRLLDAMIAHQMYDDAFLIAEFLNQTKRDYLANFFLHRGLNEYVKRTLKELKLTPRIKTGIENALLVKEQGLSEKTRRYIEYKKRMRGPPITKPPS